MGSRNQAATKTGRPRRRTAYKRNTVRYMLCTHIHFEGEILLHPAAKQTIVNTLLFTNVAIPHFLPHLAPLLHSVMGGQDKWLVCHQTSYMKVVPFLVEVHLSVRGRVAVEANRAHDTSGTGTRTFLDLVEHDAEILDALPLTKKKSARIQCGRRSSSYVMVVVGAAVVVVVVSGFSPFASLVAGTTREGQAMHHAEHKEHDPQGAANHCFASLFLFCVIKE